MSKIFNLSLILCFSFIFSSFAPSYYDLDPEVKARCLEKQKIHIKEAMNFLNRIVENVKTPHGHKYIRDFLPIPCSKEDYNLENLSKTFCYSTTKFSIRLENELADYWKSRVHLHLELGGPNNRAGTNFFSEHRDSFSERRFDTVFSFLASQQKKTNYQFIPLSKKIFFLYESTFFLKPLFRLLRIFIEDGLSYMEKNSIFLPFSEEADSFATLGCALLFSKFLFLNVDMAEDLKQKNINSTYKIFDLNFVTNLYFEKIKNKNYTSFEAFCDEFKKLNNLSQSLKKELMEKIKQEIPYHEWSILRSVFISHDFYYIFCLSNKSFYDIANIRDKLNKRDSEIFLFLYHIFLFKCYDLFLPLPFNFIDCEEKKNYRPFLLDYLYGHRDLFVPYSGFPKEIDQRPFARFKLNIDCFVNKDIMNLKNFDNSINTMSMSRLKKLNDPKFYYQLNTLSQYSLKEEKKFKNPIDELLDENCFDDFEEPSFPYIVKKNVNFLVIKELKGDIPISIPQKNTSVVKKKPLHSFFHHYEEELEQIFDYYNYGPTEKNLFKKKLSSLYALNIKNDNVIFCNNEECEKYRHIKHFLDDILFFHVGKKFYKNLYSFSKALNKPFYESIFCSEVQNFSTVKSFQETKQFLKEEINFFKDLLFICKLVFSQQKISLHSKKIYDEEIDEGDSIFLQIFEQKKSVLFTLFSFFQKHKDIDNFLYGRITYHQLLVKHFNDLSFHIFYCEKNLCNKIFFNHNEIINQAIPFFLHLKTEIYNLLPDGKKGGPFPKIIVKLAAKKKNKPAA